MPEQPLKVAPPSALGNGGRRVNPPDKIDPLNNEAPHRYRHSASSIPLIVERGRLLLELVEALRRFLERGVHFHRHAFVLHKLKG